jgi:subtilisin family serine protease
MITMRTTLRAVAGVALVGACLMASSATATAVRIPRLPATVARVGSGPATAPGVLLPAPATATSRYQPGVVLVGLRPGVASSMLPALTRAVSAREQRPLDHIGFATMAARKLQRRIGASFVLRVPSGRVLSAVAWLRRQRRFVRYAEPNYLLQVTGSTNVPNDPSFNLQWGSLNTGQLVNGISGTPGADDHAAQAWTHSTGSRSIVIGEVDTGVDYNHPDLAANIWTNPGGIGGCPAGTHGYDVLDATCDPMDQDVSYNGHGTHVAGIMGAVGNNGTGVAGMNWSTTILPVKWVSDDNVANTTSQLISALDWLLKAEQAGVNVRVVNDSTVFIGTAYSQALSDEIDALGANNILFVTAAGNSGQNNDDPRYVRYPCAYDRPTEICVTATGQNDQLPSWANYGPTTVDLGAPGDRIYSTLRNGTYGYISGSSMASAQVSGAAALILSAQNFSATALKADILNNVRPLASLSGLVRTGGILDVCSAMAGCSASPPPAVPVNTASPTISGTAQAGQTLTASTGQWSNSPTGYAYAWSRCDSGGANCSAVSGATSSSYQLQSADVGSTVRVAVTASNAAGSSAPTSSSPTGVVSSGSQSPTFGTTSVGGLSDAFAPDRKRVNAYSLSQAGSVSKLSVYLQPGTASGNADIEGVIYADSSGSPGALIATSSQLVFPSSGAAGWYDLPFASSPSLAAGRYWIGVLTGGATHAAGYRYATVSASRLYNANLYASGPSSPFGSASTDSQQMSLYATYTPG